MSDYDNQIFNSDLDGFKNSGSIATRSITPNQVIAAGGEAIITATPFETTSPDLLEILYDNSVYHSGKYKPLKLGQSTAVPDSITSGGDGSGYLFVTVDGNQVTAGIRINNPYASPLTVGPVTINFRFIPYEATF